jgi:hypothetical protein
MVAGMELMRKAKNACLLQVDYKTRHSKVKVYGIQIEGEQPHD